MKTLILKLIIRSRKGISSPFVTKYGNAHYEKFGIQGHPSLGLHSLILTDVLFDEHNGFILYE